MRWCVTWATGVVQTSPSPLSLPLRAASAMVAATVADAARSGNDCGDGLVWTTAVDHVTHNRTGLPLRRAEEEAA